MKVFTVTMTVAVSITVEADSDLHARQIALNSFQSDQSEFDRRVDTVEDITPIVRQVRRGIGSY